MSKSLISFFLLGLLCMAQATINVPYFGQHDSRWGNKILGQGPQTISQEGCFLTTTTSMVAYEGISISGGVNPSTMNDYLKAHKGFRGDILFYDAVEALGFTFEGIVTSTSSIKSAMNQGKFAHLHVLNGRHWVLATGYTSSGYTVMDPGNSKVTTYKYSDVVGCAIYSFPSSKARRLYEQHADIESAESEAGNPHEVESVDASSQNVTVPTNQSAVPPSGGRRHLRKHSAN